MTMGKKIRDDEAIYNIQTVLLLSFLTLIICLKQMFYGIGMFKPKYVFAVNVLQLPHTFSYWFQIIPEYSR